MARDGVAAVGGFGNGLGGAGGDGEAVGGDDDVGAVGRAGDFAAVAAVAEGLLGGGGEVSGGGWRELGEVRRAVNGGGVRGRRGEGGWGEEEEDRGGTGKCLPS